MGRRKVEQAVARFEYRDPAVAGVEVTLVSLEIKNFGEVVARYVRMEDGEEAGRQRAAVAAVRRKDRQGV